jgi:universal stress protein E
MTVSAPILAATDFSRHGDRAARRAARIAAEQHSALDLITVVSRSRLDTIRRALGLEAEGVEAQLVAHAQARLQSLGEELVREHGCELRCRVRSGGASGEILAHAKESGARLLVIGQHGEHGLTGSLLGGTAGKLLRNTALPLLMVRGEATRPYQTVVVATDFSASCRGALRLAVQVAPRARAHVVYALDPPYEMKMFNAGVPSDVISLYQQGYAAQARRAMGEYLRSEALAESPAVSAQLVPGVPEQAILEQAVAKHADLIVIGRSGQSLLTELLLRSVSTAVSEDARADVLVLRGTDAELPDAETARPPL